METARLFINGKSQAVRLPKAFRFQGDRVYVHRVVAGVLLLPVAEGWDSLIASLDLFSEDFLADRSQPPEQVRERAFS